jgi:hypothetical protein
VRTPRRVIRLQGLGAGDKFRRSQPERAGQAAKAGVAGVTAAGFDVRDPALVQLRPKRKLFLGQVELSSPGPDRLAETDLRIGWARHRSGRLSGRRPEFNDIRVDMRVKVR